jgi:hypothetical protein
VSGDSNGRRTEDRSGLARFSAIQVAIAGLGCAVILVVLVLVVSVLIRLG